MNNSATMNNSKLFLFTLATFNVFLYGTRAILAGFNTNQLYDDDINDDADDDTLISPLFLQTTLLACMIGGASIVFGFFHLKEWTETTRAIALAMGLLVCFMEFLALGYGAKQWQLDTAVDDADLDRRLQFLGASSAAATLTQLLWVSALFAFPLEKEAEDTAPKEVGHQSDEGEVTDEHIEDVER
jgi:hypothetical protein